MGPRTTTASRPAILLVDSFVASSRGTYVMTASLARQLDGAGWRTLTTSSCSGRVSRLADMLYSTWTLRHRYSLAGVAVYAGRAFAWAEAVCWLLRRLGKPYVLTLHAGDLPVLGGRRPNRVRRLLQSAAAVTVPSRYLLEEMCSYRADMHLIANALGIDTYPFRLRSHPRPELVWIRAFHDRYGPTAAPEVVARLARDLPDVRLAMVGPDKGDGSLARTQQRAAHLNVAERIAFCGAVPKAEVPACLDRADVFLNTTTVDNTPVSVMEAMACGLCVISTEVGGIPYLLEDGTDALLVPPNDREAMAVAVRRVLTEPGLAARLSHNARAKAERFDWSVVLPQWESLLLSVSQDTA